MNPSKACGPDEVPNWLLREYYGLLPYPVCSIINASLQERRLPTIWKCADVFPLPNKKKVDDLKKDLRPIFLSACLSKVAEDCVVQDYIKPAVLEIRISMVTQFVHHTGPCTHGPEFGSSNRR